MFFFVGRLLLILLEQDCTCLPCNLLNTISILCTSEVVFYHDSMHPRCDIYMRSFYVTHRCNKTDCQIWTDLDFVVIVVAYHFIFLNPWLWKGMIGFVNTKMCVSQAQIAGNNLVWHNFYFFSMFTSYVEYFGDVFSFIQIENHFKYLSKDKFNKFYSLF